MSFTLYHHGNQAPISPNAHIKAIELVRTINGVDNVLHPLPDKAPLLDIAHELLRAVFSHVYFGFGLSASPF